MGTEVKRKIYNHPVTPNPMKGEWNKVVDPDTGIVKWLRRRIKQKRK